MDDNDSPLVWDELLPFERKALVCVLTVQALLGQIPKSAEAVSILVLDSVAVLRFAVRERSEELDGDVQDVLEALGEQFHSMPRASFPSLTTEIGVVSEIDDWNENSVKGGRCWLAYASKDAVWSRVGCALGDDEALPDWGALSSLWQANCVVLFVAQSLLGSIPDGVSAVSVRLLSGRVRVYFAVNERTGRVDEGVQEVLGALRQQFHSMPGAQFLVSDSEVHVGLPDERWPGMPDRAGTCRLVYRINDQAGLRD